MKHTILPESDRKPMLAMTVAGLNFPFNVIEHALQSCESGYKLENIKVDAEELEHMVFNIINNSFHDSDVERFTWFFIDKIGINEIKDRHSTNRAAVLRSLSLLDKRIMAHIRVIMMGYSSELRKIEAQATLSAEELALIPMQQRGVNTLGLNKDLAGELIDSYYLTVADLLGDINWVCRTHGFSRKEKFLLFDLGVFDSSHLTLVTRGLKSIDVCSECAYPWNFILQSMQTDGYTYQISKEFKINKYDTKFICKLIDDVTSQLGERVWHQQFVDLYYKQHLNLHQVASELGVSYNQVALLAERMPKVFRDNCSLINSEIERLRINKIPLEERMFADAGLSLRVSRILESCGLKFVKELYQIHDYANIKGIGAATCMELYNFSQEHNINLPYLKKYVQEKHWN